MKKYFIIMLKKSENQDRLKLLLPDVSAVSFLVSKPLSLNP